MKLQARVKDGVRQTGQQWVFQSGGQILIGRADDCDICFDDRHISRHHAVLFLNDSHEWECRSTGRNGIYVDGRQQRAVIITSGIAIRFSPGGPIVEFEVLSEPGGRPPTSDTEPFRRTHSRRNQQRPGAHAQAEQKAGRTPAKKPVGAANKLAQSPPDVAPVPPVIVVAPADHSLSLPSSERSARRQKPPVTTLSDAVDAAEDIASHGLYLTFRIVRLLAVPVLILAAVIFADWKGLFRKTGDATGVSEAVTLSDKVFDKASARAGKGRGALDAADDPGDSRHGMVGRAGESSFLDRFDETLSPEPALPKATSAEDSDPEAAVDTGDNVPLDLSIPWLSGEPDAADDFFEPTRSIDEMFSDGEIVTVEVFAAGVALQDKVAAKLLKVSGARGMSQVQASTRATIRLAPIENVDEFAQKIRFGTAIKVDARKRTVSLVVQTMRDLREK